MAGPYPPLDEQTPAQNPYSTALTAPAVQNEAEDPDEWEYEYSTTETEVRYPSHATIVRQMLTCPHRLTT
jgi:hypothetical protein